MFDLVFIFNLVRGGDFQLYTSGKLQGLSEVCVSLEKFDFLGRVPRMFSTVQWLPNALFRYWGALGFPSDSEARALVWSSLLRSLCRACFGFPVISQVWLAVSQGVGHGRHDLL